MRTLIHVGAHKTGTSLIQKYFRDRMSLPGELPVSFISRTDTNKLIGWGQHLVEHPDRLRSRLETELTRSPKVFVSHENTLGHPFVDGKTSLYPDAQELANALASIALDLDPCVVFYVRPMADYVESFYLQTVHQGACHSFEEWYATVDPAALTWQPTVDALDDTFGAERVVIGDFSTISAGQNEFLAHFMQRCGLPLPGTLDYRPVRNASVSARGLEIALRINPFLQNIKERRATRKFLQENFSNVTGERARPMPASIREDLDARTAGEYRRLSERAR